MKYILVSALIIVMAFIGPRIVSASVSHKQQGRASFYSKPQPTASGRYFRPHYLWCAHKTLPFGTKLKVTNVKNGKSVVVTVWDRFFNYKGRVIDLSERAFSRIAKLDKGVIEVKIEIIK